MDGFNDMDFQELLASLSPKELAQMFFPYQQEQSVLDQEMGIAGEMRQPGMQRSTPMGALLGGLSNAVGNVGGAALQAKGLTGQRELGTRMQNDSVNRMRHYQEDAMERLLREKARGGFVPMNTSIA